MTKKTEEFITIILLVFASIFMAFFILRGIESLVPNGSQKLEDYRQRFEICFDYSPKRGDHWWRHDYCSNAEIEYLEVFNEIYPPKEGGEKNE